MARLVNATVTFPNGTAQFKNAWVTLRLEDVGRMDAPATILAEETFAGVAYSGEPLQFALDAPQPVELGPHNLRVHVSMTSDDQISKGDFITKEAYEVSSYPTDLSVAVELV